ncbi:MAG: hypothetical protein QXI58_02085 [Candidatus Micrarchaeia archaeon]
MTIEFLFVIIIYLTFIAILICEQKNFYYKILDEEKIANNYFDSFHVSMIVSIKNINNYKTNYRIRENCSISKEYVICGDSTRKIYVSDKYEKEIV